MSRWKRFLQLSRDNLHVAVISCGETGIAIGKGLIRELKKHSVNIDSFGITTEFKDKEEMKDFNRTFRIPGSKYGFAKRIDDAKQAINPHKEEIAEHLRKLLGKNFEGLLLVTTGSGATGLSSTLVVLELLDDQFQLKPPVLTLLPEVFENSRVQYNSAEFLFEVAFKKKARRNPIIVLDNKPNIDELDLPFSEVAAKRIKTIPIALADLLVASYEDSVNEEFDASVADLFDAMHTPGVSVFVAEELGKEYGNVESARIKDVISDSIISSTSLARTVVFDARGAFVSVFNVNEADGSISLQTEFEARQLLREFSHANPHIKFVDRKGEPPRVRAVIAGLPIPTRIIQIMKIAKDSRKRIMVEENRKTFESIELDLEAVENRENDISEFFYTDRNINLDNVGLIKPKTKTDSPK